MNILGDRIKKERENLKLTREDLAKRIGVSYSAVSMYEQGKREPNYNLIIKICKIFNCDADYLIGLTSIKKNKRNIITQNKNRMQQILELANGLTVKESNYLINQLNKSKIQIRGEWKDKWKI